MATEILMDSLKGETRVAVVEDGELAEFLLERADSVKLAGNIYLGRVENVLPGMNAAFVDIGLAKNGFLYAGDMRMDRRDFGADADKVGAELDSRTITQLVRRGQEVLVQVTKEPGGTKGPRLSSHITVPGRLTVLLPSVNYVGISRKIQDEPERARLRDLLSAIKPAPPQRARRRRSCAAIWKRCCACGRACGGAPKRSSRRRFCAATPRCRSAVCGIC